MSMDYEVMRKRLFIYSAIYDIVQIYGDTELGTCEIDTDAIAAYCCSDKAMSDLFGCNTKEEIYEKFTQDILDGFAVWQFLKISDWTKNMLMRDFETEAKKKLEKDKQIYKCLTCEYYKESHTSIGIFSDCKRPPKSRSDYFRREALKTLKKNCKYYKKAEEEKPLIP